MDELRTEEEQVEALRRWWDENGRSTLIAIGLALAAVFGWQWYGEHVENQREAASNIYQAMLNSVQGPEAGDEQRMTLRSYAKRLKEEFPGSTYAQFAALQLARDAVQSGELESAESELRWVLAKADAGSDIALVAQLRLARVVAAKGDADGALALLAGEQSGAYAAAYATARGDVLLAQGRETEAREAYVTAQALALASGQPLGAGTLSQKLDSVAPGADPGSVADGAAKGGAPEADTASDQE